MQTSFNLLIKRSSLITEYIIDLGNEFESLLKLIDFRITNSSDCGNEF